MKFKILLTAAILIAGALACGGASQTQNCKTYLACEAALGLSTDGGKVASTDNATFGPNGTCWISTTTASACDSTCASQLKDLNKLPGSSALTACQTP